MKKNTQKIMRLSSWFALSVILIFLYGCDDNSDQELKNQVIETKVKSEPKTQQDIHTAIVEKNIEAVKQHISTGTDINQKDPFGGSSPLVSAALFGHKDIVKLLINAGADLNLKNNEGATALHTSAFFGRPEIVKLLLEKGAVNGIKDNNGSTPYDAVAGPFKDVKPYYDMFGQALAPMGLKLDYEYLQKIRPVIAAMLK